MKKQKLIILRAAKFAIRLEKLKGELQARILVHEKRQTELELILHNSKGWGALQDKIESLIKKKHELGVAIYCLTNFDIDW